MRGGWSSGGGSVGVRSEGGGGLWGVAGSSGFELERVSAGLMMNPAGGCCGQGRRRALFRVKTNATY